MITELPTLPPVIGEVLRFTTREGEVRGVTGDSGCYYYPTDGTSILVDISYEYSFTVEAALAKLQPEG